MSNAETLNLVQDVFESRKSSPKNQLIAVRVKGDSMDQSGILPDDMLIVEFFTGFGSPENGEIVIAYVDNNPTIKRYMQ
ncbi:S24 family peptidase [Leptolyngbya sp. KIOST-1]|uniref:LexA family protein n=1 Tax=Leptolyngbya sp. KIOST-1 TaxID=1229172 RepID=UPI001CEC441B